LNINIRIDKDSPGLKIIGEINNKIKDLSPLMKKISLIMLSIIRKNIQVSGRPPWPPRKDTQKHRLLWKTGALVSSLHPDSDNMHAEVSTNLKYARVHQFGHTFPPREIRPVRKRALFWPGAEHPVKKVNWPGAKIPARPFMVIPDEEIATIESAAKEYLDE